MKIEEAWDIIGPIGKGQIIYLLIFAPVKLFVNVQISGEMIVEMTNQTATAAFHTTNHNVNSITMEFGLKRQILESTKSVFWFGVLLGNLILCNMADKFGRKRMIVISFAINIIIACATAFVQNWQSYMLCRFIIGFLQGGTFITIYTLVSEWYGKYYWAIVSAVLTFLSGSSKSIIALIGIHIKDWRQFLIFTSLTQIPVLLTILIFVPESPRWLISQNKMIQAEQVLRNLAKINGRKRWREIENLQIEKSSQGNVERETVKMALKNERYKIRLRGLVMAWFTIGLVNYYMLYGAARLGGTIYENLAWQGIVDLPI